nr:hypothetical protein [Tanacetum cinerariifolium]
MLFLVWSSGSINSQKSDGDAAFDGKEHDFDAKKPESEVNISPSSSSQSRKQDDKTKKEAKGKSYVESFIGYKDLSAEFEDCSDNSSNEVNAAGSIVTTVGQISPNSTTIFSAAGPSNNTASPTYGKSSFIDAFQLSDDLDMPELEEITYSDDEDDVGAEDDFSNLETSITVSPIPTSRVHKDHPVTQIIGDLSLTTQTRSMTKVVKDQSGLSQMLNDNFHTCMFACFFSQEEPKRVHQALKIQVGLKQYKKSFFNSRCKSKTFTQGHTQEEGIDYEEVFAPVARIDAIRLFLAYASFMGFMVYQMDVKSAYGTIEEEVYVCQPPGFEDHNHPDKFWITVVVKHVNDVTKLQALVDKKKVVVTEATIREALSLDDAEGVDCLPNEEIFTELARMGYEKPSTKLTFYKAFFSSQWKFLIHTILQCMSAKRTSWNEFSSSMASAVICLSSSRKFNFSKYIFDSLVGDLSTHTTKYTSFALTIKVFANTRRVGKGFSWIETPLFEGMLVEQQVDEEGDAYEHVKEVNAGDAAHGFDSGAHGEVTTVVEEPSIPSPTLPTPPPQPPQDIPSTSQLKLRVKKLKMRNKVRGLMLRRLQKVRTSQRVDTFDDTMMDDESNQKRMIDEIDQDDAVVLEDDKKEDKEVADAGKDVEEAKDETKPAEVQEVVDVVTTAKLITEVVTAASKTVTAASAIITTVEAQVPAATLTAAPARVAAASSRRRKGVVIRDPESESTTSIIIPAKTRSKDKGKGILVEEPKPLKKKQQIKQDEQYAKELHAELNKDIEWDEVIDHVKIKAKKDPAVKKYHALKRKPQTESQAMKNIILYLKNVAEQMDEEDSRALKRLNETPTEKAAKKQKLDEEVEELKRHLQIMPNEDDDVYIEATPLARKLILLVERKYPLTRFTLDQMLNDVRLEVEEESEVSLELLRFIRQQHQEGQHE